MNYNATEKKYNYFYRITNQINWKYYFGIHSTDKLDDGYFGSGRVLKEALEKYGIDNFHLTIIQNYSTRKEVSDHERLVVTSDLVENKQCYNIRTGGENEFTYNQEFRDHMSKIKKGRKIHSEEQRQKWSIERSGEGNIMFGKTHSPEAKKKISDSWIGKTHSDETKDLMKQRKTEFFQTEEGDIYRKNISERMIGELNHFFGKEHSSETKNEISNTKIEKYGSEEFLEYSRKGIEVRKENGTLSHTPETKKRISETLKNNDFCKGHPCSINGILFRTVTAALDSLHISGYSLHKRLNSVEEVWKEWFYIDSNNPLKYELDEITRNRRFKKCKIEGVIYNSILEAAEKLQLNEVCIRGRICNRKEKWSAWEYYTDEG